ncbi:MAG: hypothetical protein ACNS64_09205, partial [Candidatus Halalkalibacterium sp. M3_1C_030]
MQDWKELIFFEDGSFKEKAIRVFKHQFENNNVYRRYCIALQGVRGNKSGKIKVGNNNDSAEMIKDHIAEKARQDISNIPLLPIRAFKDARISCHPDREPDLIFRSSG